MSEIEVPIEASQEEINHAAIHGGPGWGMWVALSSSLLAVLAAISALMAGHKINEALVSQMKSSNQWAYYQAKGIKGNLLDARLDSGKIEESKLEKLKEKRAEYLQEQADIKETAESLEHQSEHELRLHEIFARAVTMFQIAIALSAIAILAKRKSVWQFGLFLGVLGLGFLIQALMS